MTRGAGCAGALPKHNLSSPVRDCLWCKECWAYIVIQNNKHVEAECGNAF